MFPAVHRSAHQGIPLFWADLPGPLTGTLTFGVGMRDEPPQLMGITHLVEHLAFRALEPLVVRHGGVVEDEVVRFHATGTAEEVVAFLNGIARALGAVGEVADDDLDREKAVHHAEHPHGYEGPGAGLLTYRFGIGGLGNGNTNDATISSLTAAELGDWSRTWLIAENAALSFTGPPPPGLDLALPSGSAPPHAESVQVIQTPCLVESTKEGVAISLIVPRETADLLGDALRFELQYRLRHELALIYSVDVFFTRVDERNIQLDLILDPLPDQVAATVEAAVMLLRRLATNGFSHSAVGHAHSEVRTSSNWVDTRAGEHLDALATSQLTERTCSSPGDVLRAAEGIDGGELTRVLADALPSLMVAFDEDAELDERWLESAGLPIDDFHAWQTDRDESRHRRARRGRVWRATRRGDVPGQFAILGDGLLKAQDGSHTGTIRFDDLVLVGRRECGCLALIDARGRSGTVDPRDWVRGQDLVDRILARVPAEIVRNLPAH